MKKYKLTSYLGIFFIIAVIIPSVILSVIAVRSVNHEEVFIEKRLEDALLVEVNHVAVLIKQAVEDIEKELNRTLYVIGSDYEKSFSQWKTKSSMVGIPFLLSRNNDFLWPVSNNNLGQQELSFFKWGGDLLRDKVAIPVYENIALVYKKSILNETELDLEAQDKVDTYESKETLETEIGQAQSSSTGTLNKNRYEKTEDSYGKQYAVSRFSQSAPIRKKVYEQAKGVGQQVFKRKVVLKSKELKNNEEIPQESMFISEPLTFSQITSKGEFGIIPRLVNEKLKLIFWKKQSNGNIAGCVIDEINFKKKIVGMLPDIYTPVRILTLLDETGNPLITPQDNQERDWRRPFVAREISEKLPHWESAAYLTDSNVISSKARVFVFTMWILIIILFVSIVGGGIVVLRSLHSEITLAQQKTTFVANVSHELKTPLTSIRMFAEMLKEKLQPDPEKREKYFNLMVSETERLTRLINNVLDFSKRGQGKKRYNIKQLEIVSLYKEIIEIQRVRLEHNGFEVNFVDEGIRILVNADEESIKQAVLNLISNAEKYSADTKKIDFEIDIEDKDIIFKIKDRGVGIAPNQVKKVFDEFYRVDDTLTSKVSGTGLGLTIAKRIIQDLGGDIIYKSREGGGSIFQIRLAYITREVNDE
ncbi:MAG: HAMP domain-containing histidine kinase [Candidatus Omnitrophica bacterium]|nr:HAMP domain-containing histidine kinase [Candidatus Omnitrophota bacterium]